MGRGHRPFHAALLILPWLKASGLDIAIGPVYVDGKVKVKCLMISVTIGLEGQLGLFLERGYL